MADYGSDFGYNELGGGYTGGRFVRILDAYMATEYSAWLVGSNIESGDSYGGIGGSADVRVLGRFTKVPLTPGDYVATAYSARLSFMSTRCDRLDFVICKLVGSDLEVVATEDITPQKPVTDDPTSFTATLSDIDFEIEEGVTYYFGSWLRGTETRLAGEPGYRLQTASSSDAYYTFTTSSGVGTSPTTFTPTLGTADVQVIQRMRVLTKNRIVYSNSSISVGAKPLIPIRETGITSIKLDSVVVADAGNLNIKLNSISSVARETVTVDFVNDDVEINATTQSLAGQDGDTFDLLCQLDLANRTTNLLYLNRTDGQGGESATDITTISHAAKSTTTRGASYAKGGENAADYSYASIEGTGTIAKLEIGYEPVVIFGDSMSSFSGRIGQYLPTAFTEDRMFWRAQISGNSLSTTSSSNHTAGYLRYKSVAPGTGDLCEIRDCVFCLGMYGLNDVVQVDVITLSTDIPSEILANDNDEINLLVEMDEATIMYWQYSDDSGSTWHLVPNSRVVNPAGDTVTAAYFLRVEEIIDDLQLNGNQPLLIGLAPYHVDPGASPLEARTIIDWNRRSGLLAASKHVAWYNPWYFVVDRSTTSDSIPRIKEVYTSDGGVHINSAAADPISAKAVSIFESGLVRF